MDRHRNVHTASHVQLHAESSAKQPWKEQRCHQQPHNEQERDSRYQVNLLAAEHLELLYKLSEIWF
jgi:hypothetical protein